jgi:hypothetical protein
MTRQEAVDAVLKLLVTGGWLASPGEETPAGGGAAPTPGTSGSMIRVGPFGSPGRSGPAVRRL